MRFIPLASALAILATVALVTPAQALAEEPVLCFAADSTRVAADPSAGVEACARDAEDDPLPASKAKEFNSGTIKVSAAAAPAEDVPDVCVEQAASTPAGPGVEVGACKRKTFNSGTIKVSA